MQFPLRHRQCIPIGQKNSLNPGPVGTRFIDILPISSKRLIRKDFLDTLRKGAPVVEQPTVT
jgi:hypothetical protein